MPQSNATLFLSLEHTSLAVRHAALQKLIELLSGRIYRLKYSKQSSSKYHTTIFKVPYNHLQISIQHSSKYHTTLFKVTYNTLQGAIRPSSKYHTTLFKVSYNPLQSIMQPSSKYHTTLYCLCYFYSFGLHHWTWPSLFIIDFSTTTFRNWRCFVISIASCTNTFRRRRRILTQRRRRSISVSLGEVREFGFIVWPACFTAASGMSISGKHTSKFGFGKQCMKRTLYNNVCYVFITTTSSLHYSATSLPPAPNLASANNAWIKKYIRTYFLC